jgi:uncharacterized protein YjbI with pentapeptide repeats
VATVNGAFTAAVTAQAAFAGQKIITSGFPHHQLNAKVELLVNTTWTDITHYVLVRDDLTMVIGRPDEASSMNASTLTVTLKNTDGRFTPDNSSGAYYPYVQLNTQIRVSVTDNSVTGVAYTGYRFWGEVSEWPPQWDPTGKDVYATISASGIWRRLSQSTTTIGSPYTRYTKSLANVAAYWPMEDGQGATTFATLVPATSNAMTMVTTNGSPSLASCSAFPGSDAIPQLSGAEFNGQITSSSHPSHIFFRHAMFVQGGGDSGVTAGQVVSKLHTAGTVATIEVGLASAAGGGPITITGYNGSNSVLFTGSITANIWGIPYLVQVSLDQVSSNVQWEMRLIIPNTNVDAGTVRGLVPGTVDDATVVIFNNNAAFQGVSVGQASVIYGDPSIATAAYALGGWNGENALTRFQRICTEQGIPTAAIGSTSTTMGPQLDDTLVNVLQTVEDTDGGLIYETQNMFGLGYRTMSSLQNQTSALTLNYASQQVGQPLAPVNDDALVRNDITLTNYDGYAVRVFLQNGARSLNPPPNGVGSGYSYSRNTNSTSHTQVNALGSQILNTGTVAQNRYPNVTVNLARVTTAPLFNSAPAMREGDYLQITNMPSFGGLATQKQLVWGWTETINDYTWNLVYNTIPEAPWESSFNPGTSATGQVPGAPITAGQSNTVTGAQIAEGAIIGSNIATGGVTGSNIATAAITAVNIADATITGTQIAAGGIGATNIANASITAAQIANATITSTQISGSANITGSQIASATITGSNMVNATITATQIANATITGAKLVSGTITATQIANATITGSNLVNGTITATQIASATITSSQISSSAGITGSQIASGTIAAGNITNATITNTQIASGTITGSNIGASTITGSNMANATITNVQISNGTITTTQISNSANITGTQIATGTVAGSNIAAGTITASNIAAGTITATQIAANTITAGKLVGGIVVAGIVDATTITGASIVTDGATGQFLIYSGTPAGGNLIGSWSGASGSDSFGNTYPAGLSVQQGVITGIDIDSVTITNATLQGDILQGSTITNPTINGGTIDEAAITFDSGGGSQLVYTSSTTTVTQTANGAYTFTVPAGVTSLMVECWGAGAGGNGGTTSLGGSGGGAGQYSAHLNYPCIPGQVFSYTVGNGGGGGTTGSGNGGDGGDTFFDGSGGVYANGGQGNGNGGTGVQGAGTVFHTGGNGGGVGSTGGASGGNSANASPTSGTGNSGAASTTSTGHASPSAQTGSGTGGAGGNSGANGSNGGAPGAGGGGAGKGSTTSTLTKTYAPLWSGSYLGPDATSGANTLRSAFTMYQGGETASGGAANGNQYSIFAFDRATIAADFSGFTVTATKLQLANLHSWYGSGMTIAFDEYAGLPGSVPSTGPRGNYFVSPASATTAEGATNNFSLPASVGQRFVTGSDNGMGIGYTTYTNHPYNLGYYGYFDGSQTRLTITGTGGSAGSFSAGNGADGQVKITYISSTTLGAAVAPVSGTDSSSNAYAAGFTGHVAAFQPGSSPTAVETWHTLSISLTGWATTTGGQIPLQYCYVPIGPNGSIWIVGDITGTAISASTAIATLPTGYRPTGGNPLSLPVCRFGGTLSSADDGICQISTSGALQPFNCNGATRLIFNAVIPIL